ncbi:MAG: M48 family metallopeptidase [Muribaculaceae bacterium]|nr:M48 family metallopeptidase [Muribaculaceae bacterium]
MPVIGEINHRQLGRVVISSRPNSRRATARWRNGLVSLNVPRQLGLPAINRLLDDFAPRLLACRPSLRYSAPSRMSFPGVDFVIARQSVAPSRMLAKASLPVCSLEIGTDFDLDDDATTRMASTLLCRMARKVAPDILLPRARELAARIGRNPVGWTISTGFRTLGSCSFRGYISLSYVLVFLPADLRDYIICHELAHLSEMNHSPRFHTLLDSYLDGREAILAARLRQYSWPVLRR